ncbi:hypothetical protein BJX62DRAFT_218928 [Aspergillus germanicus]
MRVNCVLLTEQQDSFKPGLGRVVGMGLWGRTDARNRKTSPSLQSRQIEGRQHANPDRPTDRLPRQALVGWQGRAWERDSPGERAAEEEEEEAPNDRATEPGEETSGLSERRRDDQTTNRPTNNRPWLGGRDGPGGETFNSSIVIEIEF